MGKPEVFEPRENFPAMRRPSIHYAGFTLIEVVAVLVILAILSAVAMSRVGSVEPNLRSEVNDLKAALRYAQQMAIASDSVVTFGVTVTAGGYTLVRTGGSGSQPVLPGEGSSSHTFKGVTATAGTFNFNEWGGLAAGSSVATTLTGSGGGSETITVVGETGYAYES
ncbi:MAG: GspH/FimT family pseudopilin [Thermodesulfobacteriota bacterium]